MEIMESTHLPFSPRRTLAALSLFLIVAGGLGWRWETYQDLSAVVSAEQIANEDEVIPIEPALPGMCLPLRDQTPRQSLVPDDEPERVLLETGRVTLRESSRAVRRYRLALDEIYDMTSGSEGLRRIPVQPSARALADYTAAEAVRGTPWPAMVLYPEKGPADKSTRRILTGKMLVALEDAATAAPALAAAGLKLVERPSYSPDHLITQSKTGSPLEALASIRKLGNQAKVVSVTPLLKREVEAMALPNDPLFQQQWHLLNSGQGKGVAKMDAQATEVWDQYQGDGIHIAIVDTGIQMGHEDLAGNVEDFGHLELSAREGGAPGEDVNGHGTAVAGIVAGVGNNSLGGSGVAPQAKLHSHRVLNGATALDDSQIADATVYGAYDTRTVTDELGNTTTFPNTRFIEVKNNSWGWVTGPMTLGESGPLFQDAMKFSAELGRGGLGVISVWASGNGRTSYEQGNKGGLANDIHAIAVGALTNTGKLATYSETGAHLTCVGPSGGGTLDLVSTDMAGLEGMNPDPEHPDMEGNNYSYTRNLQGTSFSAPVVSGVCALMLQANPALSWRDVKEILLRSSLQVDPRSATWVKRTGNQPLLPPIKHSNLYGGGLVQAKAAVDMAKSWTQLGPQISVSKKIDPNLAINYTGTQPKPDTVVAAKHGTIITPPEKPKRRTLKTQFDMRGIQPMRVENVSVTLDISHAYRGDMIIILRSPSGVTSTLANASEWDFGTDYANFNFSSMRHWGESGQGLWTIEITDKSIQDDGTFESAVLSLTGTAAPAAEIISQSGPQLVAEGTPATLFVNSALSSEGGTRVWRKNGKVIPKQTLATLSGVGQKVTDAGTYDHLISNQWGHIASTVIPIAVLRRNVPAISLVEGKTATFSAVAAGVGLTYDWYRSASTDPLVDNGRVTGTRTPKLTIQAATALDEDTYFCRVTMLNPNFDPETEERLPPYGVMDTLPAQLSLRRRPQVNATALTTPSIVSESVLRQLTANSEVTRWTITGLPPGVTYNSKTGAITGSPTTPGYYWVTITVSNSLGAGTPVGLTWEVKPLPTGVLGTFHGLVDRNTRYNGGYGGAFTLTTTSTGAYSGTISRGIHQHSFTGRLSTTATNGAPFSGQVSLTRRAPYGPLTFRFDLIPSEGRLDGSLTDPAVIPADVALIEGLRAAFSATVPATAYAGRWNTAYELPSPLLSKSTYPQGATWGTQTVSTSGLATWAGRLADGTVITGSAGIAADGSTTLHVMLYDFLGSVQGWQTLDSGTQESSGALTWVKSPISTTRSYAAGFPTHDLIGSGALYSAPMTGEMLFGISPGTDNASLNFAEGGLAASFTQIFSLGTGNLITLPSGSANPHQIQFALDLATGILTGNGLAMDIDPLTPSLNRQRPGTFSALLIPVREQAVGYFLLPTGQSTTAPILSGKLIGAEAQQ
jgi:subtilisin family serine protease/subtilisin-like proprotein convertase family protein